MSAILLLAAVSSFSWRACVPEGGIRHEAEGDHVKIELTGVGGRRGGGDGFVAAKIPLYRRGTLDFDVRVVRPDGASAAMAEFLTFYGIRTYFHDSLRDWRLIRDQPVANRESGFNDEPVRHFRIATVSEKDWHHVRIAFDYDADRVDFYFDDMEDPAYVAAKFPVWSEQEYKGGELCIGGMGLSRGGSAEFRNLRLAERTAETQAVPRTETLVLNGIASEFFQIHRFLQAERPRVYAVDGTRRANFNYNCFAFRNLPGEATLARARRIVLVDVPAGPNEILPDFAQGDIAKAVKEGAELTVIEGPWSLDKGEYRGGPLAAILPEGALGATAFKRPVDKMDVKILHRQVGKGNVRVVVGYRFPSSPSESVHLFQPYAERLFPSLVKK